MSLKEFMALILLSGLLVSCVIPEKERDTYNKIYNNDIKTQSLYLYQSVLRIANVNQDPEINKLIKDLDRVDLHILKGKDPKSDLKTLSKQLRTDGFEDLISARTADNGHINLKSREKSGDEKFVVVGNMEGNYMFVEIHGKLNLEYLNALSKADWSLLTDHVGGLSRNNNRDNSHHSNKVQDQDSIDIDQDIMETSDAEMDEFEHQEKEDQ